MLLPSGEVVVAVAITTVVFGATVGGRSSQVGEETEEGFAGLLRVRDWFICLCGRGGTGSMPLSCISWSIAMDTYNTRHNISGTQTNKHTHICVA